MFDRHVHSLSRRRFISGLGAATIGALPIRSGAAWTQARSETSTPTMQSRRLLIEHPYLNVPISSHTSASLFQLSVDGKVAREFPLQLADDAIDYWLYLDVSEFQGREIVLSGPVSDVSLSRVYQADTLAGKEQLYRESNRPQFHFTVKRGWNNDVNGPIYYRGKYHLFWQAFPFGLTPDVGFMYWGHAISSDLLHWTELFPALMVDKLGSPWSGTAVVDHHNAAGWGKGTLILAFTAFDRKSQKQVQCLAHSRDNAQTFTRFADNPIIDSNRELNTFDTRDPKVFWYEPRQHWVLVLFEKDGMSFYRSTDLKAWERRSHFPNLHECPDFFEMAVDGDVQKKKWVLHGGSATYFIGSFDGDTFTPESPALRYAEGTNRHGDDVLYAAQSFAEMPGNRRIQMAWGRIEQDHMPFNQMFLFPTEFTLASTPAGPRLRTTPIHEIELLHSKRYAWNSLTVAEANRRLQRVPTSVIHLKATLASERNEPITVQYDGKPLATIQPADFDNSERWVEILIDKSLAEIFVGHGARYILRDLPGETHITGLEFSAGNHGTIFDRLELFEMKSIWS